MNQQTKPRDWTGLPSPARRVLVQGPWDQKRPLWWEMVAITLAVVVGLVIGHALQ